MHELSAPTSKPSDLKRFVDPFCVRPLLSLIHRDFYVHVQLVSIEFYVLDQQNKQSCIKWINAFLMSLGLDVRADSSCIKKDQGIKESCIKRIKESTHVLKSGSTTLYEV